MDEASPRPGHVIRPEEVDGWLADSVNKVVTYHRTTSEAARDIRERGVAIAQSRIGAYGQGFYTITEADPFFGPAELTLAVRLQRPIQGSQDDIERVIDDAILRLFGPRMGLTPPVATAVRRDLLGLGYDGIIVKDGGGDGIDYVIALDASTV